MNIEELNYENELKKIKEVLTAEENQEISYDAPMEKIGYTKCYESKGADVTGYLSENGEYYLIVLEDLSELRLYELQTWESY